MNKKRPHKKIRKSAISRKPTLVFSLLVVGSFFLLFFGSVQLFRMTNTVHVLGASSVLSDNIEVSADEREQKEKKNSEVSEQEQELKNARLEKIKKALQVEDDTLVDCVGSDEKHFTTTYHACYELNMEADNEHFSFTPLTKSSNTSEKKKRVKKEKNKEKSLREKEKKIPTPEETQSELQKEEQMQQEKKRLQEELMKDDGIINSQSELQEELANWEKDEEKVTLETSDQNTQTIKHKNTKTKSIFPVSVDPETNELSITTPAGTKIVTILPEKAVENILRSHKLSNIETEMSSESGEMTQKVVLTELNDEPVFAVNGVSEKKVFGVIPVAFSKTVYVSGEDGAIVKTDQSLLNTMLETISF